MIAALSLFDHINIRDGPGSRASACRWPWLPLAWPASLQQQGSVALGLVAIGVVVGDDIHLSP